MKRVPDYIRLAGDWGYSTKRHSGGVKCGNLRQVDQKMKAEVAIIAIDILLNVKLK